MYKSFDKLITQQFEYISILFFIPNLKSSALCKKVIVLSLVLAAFSNVKVLFTMK